MVSLAKETALAVFLLPMLCQALTKLWITCTAYTAITTAEVQVRRYCTTVAV